MVLHATTEGLERFRFKRGPLTRYEPFEDRTLIAEAHKQGMGPEVEERIKSLREQGYQGSVVKIVKEMTEGV